MIEFRFVGAALAALALVLASLPAHAADDGTVTVFAASSLTSALQDIGQSYQVGAGRHTASPNNIVFSFAASSVLAKQIESSSGADIFFSADADWMDYLDTRGLIAHETRKNLLGNHLVLIAPAASRITLSIAPHFGLASALQGERLAIADPDFVPAGKYARTALGSLGVWNDVADHLAQAENVRVALAYVARGESPLGIVYATDALAEPKVRVVGTFPDDSHPPIVYPVALTKDAKPGAARFLDYLCGQQARAIFEKAGFIVFSTEKKP